MQKLRVGFIGSGGMAAAHLKGLASPQFEDIELAAFCDVVQERAEAQCAQYPQHNPKAYSAPRDMIADAGLDACYILLPPFAHGDAERACIEGGVPFLVEKPIGNDKVLLKELRDEVVKKNLITAAGYMNRYQPGVRRAKGAFAADEPVLAYGGWLGAPPLESKPRAATSFIYQWWTDKSKSGGQFVEQVTHTVDLVRYFLGDAVEVFAHATTAFNKKLPNLRSPYTIDDAMTTSIRFENGALANIWASIATPVGGGVSLEILGTAMAVKFSGWGHDARILTRSEGETHEEKVASASEIFPVEDRIFLDAVRSGDRSAILTDYPDAYKTILVSLAANQSAQSGRPVDVSS